VVTSKSSLDKFLSPPITPMKARAVKSFPVGPDWMYEPKWDGFRCVVFRDEENIFLQSGSATESELDNRLSPGSLAITTIPASGRKLQR
jgi:hypothetical protein